MKIEQLSPRSCRHPTSPDDVDKDEHRFGCAEPAMDGRPYCQHHHEMSVDRTAEPWSDEERAILKMLRADKLR